MITILDGKLTVPENQRFIGFAGDNLNRKIEFMVKNHTNPKNIYRLYLTFSDGTVNYFTLPATVTSEGALLIWEVQQEHIFSSGIVYAQIKAFTESGVIFHTNKETFIVGSSSEFSDHFEKNNTEFLEYEQKLNALRDYVDEAQVLTPYIGENGNWFVYDKDNNCYVDTGKPSVGKAETFAIADGSVTSAKIASGAVTAPKLGQYSVTTTAIVPEAVTEEKLAESAVTSEKIADGAVTHEKLSEGAVLSENIANGSVKTSHLSENLLIPDSNLEDSYWKIRTYIPAYSYADLDNIFENEHASDTLYQIKFSGLSPVASVVGRGDFIALVSSEYNVLILFNKANGEFWSYKKESSTATKLSFAEQNYDPESENAQSGKAVAKAISAINQDFLYIGNFDSLSNLKAYPFEVDKTYRFGIGVTLDNVMDMGEYIGIYREGTAGRTLHYTAVVPDGRTYTFNLDTESYSINDTISTAKAYTDDKIGEMVTVLDELHTYAEGLQSGGASE